MILRNNLTKVTEPSGTVGAPLDAITVRKYVDAIQVIEVITAMGFRSTYDYDKVGRVVEETIFTTASPGNSGGQNTRTWNHDYVG